MEGDVLLDAASLHDLEQQPVHRRYRSHRENPLPATESPVFIHNSKRLGKQFDDIQGLRLDPAARNPPRPGFALFELLPRKCPHIRMAYSRETREEEHVPDKVQTFAKRHCLELSQLILGKEYQLGSGCRIGIRCKGIPRHERVVESGFNHFDKTDQLPASTDGFKVAFGLQVDMEQFDKGGFKLIQRYIAYMVLVLQE